MASLDASGPAACAISKRCAAYYHYPSYAVASGGQRSRPGGIAWLWLLNDDAPHCRASLDMGGGGGGGGEDKRDMGQHLRSLLPLIQY